MCWVASIDAKCGFPPTIQVNNIPSNIASHTTAEKRGNTQYDNPHMMSGCVEGGRRRWARYDLGGYLIE
jgi:hypothetical protein